METYYYEDWYEEENERLNHRNQQLVHQMDAIIEKLLNEDKMQKNKFQQ